MPAKPKRRPGPKPTTLTVERRIERRFSLQDGTELRAAVPEIQILSDRLDLRAGDMVRVTIERIWPKRRPKGKRA